MKLRKLNRIGLIFIFFILCFSQSVLAVSDSDIRGYGTGSNIPVYRLYSAANSKFLYTSYDSEVNELTKNGGWINQGIAWYAPRTSTESGIYRLFNPRTGTHLYTSDTNEVATLRNSGWTADYDAKPIFYSGGSTPVYRVYNPNTGNHLLTTDSNEYNTLSNIGWNAEGIKFYSTDKNYYHNYPLKNNTIESVSSDAAIQADVYLSGIGTGYHAKILMQTPTSAVSFGIQYDVDGAGEYQGKGAFIIENVANNNQGNQRYTRVGFADTCQWYRLLLVYKSNGVVECYVNGNLVGSVNNNLLTGNNVNVSIEGSARLNGDYVDTTFDNVKIKGSGSYNPKLSWRPNLSETNPGIHVIKLSNSHIRIFGAISGLKPNENWDNAYDRVSGVAQYPLSQNK